MNTSSPENGQYSTSGVASPLSGAHSTPAIPVNIPERTNANHRARRTRMPIDSARTSLSRMACRDLPKGDCTIRHINTAQTVKTART